VIDRRLTVGFSTEPTFATPSSYVDDVNLAPAVLRSAAGRQDTARWVSRGRRGQAAVKADPAVVDASRE
jgi:hypothetical protein